MLAEQAWHKLFELPQIAIVGGLMVGFLVPMVGIIAHYWHKTQKVQSDNTLRREMVARGMSVDEIERIMAAGVEEEDDT